MNRSLVALLLLLASFSVRAGEISDSDMGIYFFKGRDGAPNNHFALTKEDGKWVLKDKESGGPVAKLQCLSGCEYRATTEGENEKLFPASYRQMQDMACLKNVSFAFCRMSAKKLPVCGKDPVPAGAMCRLGAESPAAKPSYLMIPLFATKAAPISIWRLDAQ
jgi:hypothetical protein